MENNNSEREKLARQKEEFLNAELARSTINGMIGMVSNKLLNKAGLTEDRVRELESQYYLLATESHMLYCGDLIVRKKVLEEYAPFLKAYRLNGDWRRAAGE
ncbi:MAG: hypothetical protein LBO05_03540 [Deltaproteobacteria bacterium]|jgi:hypothetical protein|nr:hypothetical protein [Deltaproteobacteria bacterium]